MVTRIVVTGLLLAAFMGALKDGRILRLTGLTGSCSVVQTTAGGDQLEECRAGRLEGLPSLSRQGCSTLGAAAGREYWKCPAPLEATLASR